VISLIGCGTQRTTRSSTNSWQNASWQNAATGHDARPGPALRSAPLIAVAKQQRQCKCKQMTTQGKEAHAAFSNIDAWMKLMKI